MADSFPLPPCQPPVKPKTENSISVKSYKTGWQLKSNENYTFSVTTNFIDLHWTCTCCLLTQVFKVGKADRFLLGNDKYMRLPLFRFKYLSVFPFSALSGSCLTLFRLRGTQRCVISLAYLILSKLRMLSYLFSWIKFSLITGLSFIF